MYSLPVLTVSRATLHNASEVARKGVLIGDLVVLVESRGCYSRDRRPAAAARDGSEYPFVMPERPFVGRSWLPQKEGMTSLPSNCWVPGTNYRADCSLGGPFLGH